VGDLTSGFIILHNLIRELVWDLLTEPRMTAQHEPPLVTLLVICSCCKGTLCVKAPPRDFMYGQDTHENYRAIYGVCYKSLCPI